MRFLAETIESSRMHLDEFTPLFHDETLLDASEKQVCLYDEQRS